PGRGRTLYTTKDRRPDLTTLRKRSGRRNLPARVRVLCVSVPSALPSPFWTCAQATVTVVWYLRQKIAAAIWPRAEAATPHPRARVPVLYISVPIALLSPSWIAAQTTANVVHGSISIPPTTAQHLDLRAVVSLATLALHPSLRLGSMGSAGKRCGLRWREVRRDKKLEPAPPKQACSLRK